MALRQSRGAYFISLVFGIAYAVQSWIYAHTQISVLDEGAYLVKGLLFASGRYAPFQDYGPLTNHMPLAFLIPGWMQVIFGPGLRTGRYFVIFLGILMLVGLWLLVKRLRGPWWAAGAIGIVAVNPALIKMYSVGVSQVLVSCFLVWTLFFAITPKRKDSHLIVASILAAAVWFTRINMAPILLLLLAYIWWEYGKGTFWKCAVAGFGLLILGHILYWPGILKLWAYWVPDELTPFLETWRLPPEAMPRWSPEISFEGRVNSFLQAIRFNFLPLAGLLAGLVLWDKTIWKKNKFEGKILILLATLFILLFILHAAASLGRNYCVYCFQVYLGFFDVVAIVFLILSVSYWVNSTSSGINFLSALFVLLLVTGVAYAASGSFGGDWLRPRVVRNILETRVPNGVELGTILQNKLAIDNQGVISWARRELLQWIPVTVGLILGLLVLVIIWWLSKARPFPSKKQGSRFSARAWGLVLVIGFVLSPTKILSSAYTTYDCKGDVISSYESAGEVLARYVVKGGLVYWTGGDSAVPLLYTPDAEIFPTQLNDGYTFRIGGDSEAIHRLSYWDEQLQTEWLTQADYLLIEDRFYDEYWVNTGDWVHQAETPPVDSCREGASIHVLKRLPSN